MERKKLKGAKSGQLTPTNPGEILHHLESCLTCEAGERRRMRTRQGTFEVMIFNLPKSPLLMIGFPGDGSTPACP